MKALWVLGLFVLTGCTVKYSYLKTGYDRQGKDALKRIALFVEPTAGGVPGLSESILRMQREFLSIEKPFLLPPDPPAEVAVGGRARICERDRSLHGVLVTEVRRLERREAKVAVSIRTVLYDCRGERVWDTMGEGVYKSEDSSRRPMVKVHAAAFGEGVTPFVVPVYELLRRLLDALPAPKLTQVEERERIQLFASPPRAEASPAKSPRSASKPASRKR